MTDVPFVTVPPGYRADAKGNLVREANIRPTDLLEDQLVEKVMGYADDLSAQIARFRSHCFDDVGAYLALLAEKYGSTPRGKKGNMTFTSFDGRMKVQVQVADRMTFGPELQIARDLIDECIAEWAAGANDQIRALVEHAFQTDREGQVSRDAVFALRRVEIQDERWQRAMAAITDSIRIVGSKTYLRFYRRSEPTAPWQAVSIDLASA